MDGGTIDLIRGNGIEVVSSAELIQFFEARLNEKALQSHLAAGQKVDAIRARPPSDWIGKAVRSGHEINEWQAAEFVRQRFSNEGLVTDNGPIVAVDGARRGPALTSPPVEGSAPHSNLVVSCCLICGPKLDRPEAIFYDITWTGFCGSVVPDKINRVFEVVRDARKAATQSSYRRLRSKADHSRI